MKHFLTVACLAGVNFRIGSGRGRSPDILNPFTNLHFIDDSFIFRYHTRVG